MSWDKESVYDERIAPLMAQVIAVCKEHAIPMAASFQYALGADDVPAYCSTVVPGNDAGSFLSDIQMRICREARP